MQAKSIIHSCVLFLLIFMHRPAQAFRFVHNEADDLEVFLDGKFKPEAYYGKNISLFNNNLNFDQVVYARQTLDFGFDIIHGGNQFDTPTTELSFIFRNKITWGSLFGIGRTTDTPVKIGDVVSGSHAHGLLLLFPWMREAWLYLDLNRALNRLDMENKHTLTIGAFPFQVGRGIALGSAYAVGPGYLGFYSDGMIDQYAFGAKLFGECKPKKLSYDLYFSIAQNKSTSIGETSLAIYGQEYGRRSTPERGFGMVHFITAARLNWKAFDSEHIGTLNVEPYLVYDNDPEQKLEFNGDASTRLGTLGLAAEYAGKQVEFGFDLARNVGRQTIKGWDRNQLEHAVRNARVEDVYTHVYLNADPTKPFPAGSPSLSSFRAPYSPLTISSSGAEVKTNAQKIIDGVGNFEDATRNGTLLGTATGLTDATDALFPVQDGVLKDQLYNGLDRYRNPFYNIFRGAMFVADLGYWIHNRQIQFAVTGAIVTGDSNPNDDPVTGHYNGFISLQELYSGKRVQSVFLLGGSGRPKRLVSTPLSVQEPTRFASEVSGLTNLRFVGGGFTWKPKGTQKEFSINTNILAYWQDEATTRKFDLYSGKQLNELASKQLGVETNLFINYNLLKDLKSFLVMAVFIPGQHYQQIKGTPLNSGQQKAIDRFNNAGFSTDVIPNISDNPAFTINIGMEYKF